jgi:hypothetical protein
MTGENLESRPIRMPLLRGMCPTCQLLALGFAQRDGDRYMTTLLRLATLARSEGHSRFDRRMKRRSAEAKLGINLQLLSQLTFVRQTEEGLELSKITPPVPDNDNGDKIE